MLFIEFYVKGEVLGSIEREARVRANYVIGIIIVTAIILAVGSYFYVIWRRRGKGIGEEEKEAA